MDTSDNGFLRGLLGLPPEPTGLGGVFSAPPSPVRPTAFLGSGPGVGYAVTIPSSFPVRAVGLTTPPVGMAPTFGSTFSVNSAYSLARRSGALAAAPQRRKRRTFFSFHFDDLFRVNNVRNQAPGGETTFYDSSLWESRKLSSDDAIKRLIREGIDFTSVVCVLAGTHTYSRRWCRYEIARAVIDNKGLLAVDINGLRHHLERIAHPRGPNPLDYMAVGKIHDGTYRLFELKLGRGQLVAEWSLYEDYREPVDLPNYLPEPAVGYAARLSSGTAWYDYVAQGGSRNLGEWVDAAAARVGR